MKLRLHLQSMLAALCAAALLITLYWIHCGELPNRPVSVLSKGLVQESDAGSEEDIECSINGEYSISCRRHRGEVYVPFKFLHKYFEIYGKITSVNGVDKFEWSHSYSKIYHPKKKYDPRDTFITFENYNVESRDRVKCISGIEGVPVSTQWEPKGFYYPTQIAQFGLAHYSKNVTEPEPRVRVIDDSEKRLENWIVSQGASMSREFDAGVQSNVLHFSTTGDANSQVWLRLNVTQDFVLGLDIMLKPNSSITVVLQNKESKETVYLHYITSLQLIYAQEDHIYYGVGVDYTWKRLTRDLIIDMQKGWALNDKPKRKSPRSKFKLSSIILSGAGCVDNVTVSSSAHWAQFMSAAEWLRRNQRPRSGAWSVAARRRLPPPLADLEPGWYSAMSQGHGMSVLSRAYSRTGDARYLLAARRALRVLDVPAHKRGVRALWMAAHVWYEEYPTKPPLFVLNGFIYTLLGLYDLYTIEGENSVSSAKKMFDDGMTSLKTLLPLFDTGSGSFYDLRHYTLGVSPNIARWDYHATHVNQLYLLAGLDDDPVIINTAKRWEGYMTGKRAAHN